MMARDDERGAITVVEEQGNRRSKEQFHYCTSTILVQYVMPVSQALKSHVSEL